MHRYTYVWIGLKESAPVRWWVAGVKGVEEYSKGTDDKEDDQCHPPQVRLPCMLVNVSQNWYSQEQTYTSWKS